MEFADSDLWDVDLDLAAVIAPTQVSRHFSSVRGISQGASRHCHPCAAMRRIDNLCACAPSDI